jgi:hypothetical protein
MINTKKIKGLPLDIRGCWTGHWPVEPAQADGNICAIGHCKYNVATSCNREKQNKNMPMEQCTLKNVNNCWNTSIYSYLETSGGQSSNLYLNVVYFFNTSVN